MLLRQFTLVAVMAFAGAMLCAACGTSRDEYSYNVGRGVSDQARWISEEYGVDDVEESCRRAVRTMYANELAMKEIVGGQEDPEPDGVVMDDAIAGCVDAYN